MAYKKLIFKIIFILLIFVITPLNSIAGSNSDQWIDSNKSYKDLIMEGFEVKAYDVNTIETKNGFFLLLFITVLQKNKQIYECQEYQTLDDLLETLDLTMYCRELVQPYEKGLGT